MTHRALVAFETSDSDGEPLYNVHFSQNGAESLMLKPVLEEFLTRDGESLSDLPAIKGAAIQELEDSFTSELLAVEDDLITEEPLTTEVARSELGDVVNYVFHEALFVCTGTDVEVFLPVFVCPDVLKPFRRHVALYADRPTVLSDDPREIATLPERGASIELSGAKFSTLDLDADSPEVDLLVTALQGLLQGVYTSKTRSDTHSEAVTQLWLDDWIIVCEIKDVPSMEVWEAQGSGFLIEFEEDTLHHRELMEVFHDSRQTANELLLETSLRRENAVSQREAEIEALGSLLRDVVTTFNYDISTLSPDPFPDLVESL